MSNEKRHPRLPRGCLFFPPGLSHAQNRQAVSEPAVGEMAVGLLVLSTFCMQFYFCSVLRLSPFSTFYSMICASLFGSFFRRRACILVVQRDMVMPRTDGFKGPRSVRWSFRRSMSSTFPTFLYLPAMLLPGICYFNVVVAFFLPHSPSLYAVYQVYV